MAREGGKDRGLFERPTWIVCWLEGKTPRQKKFDSKRKANTELQKLRTEGAEGVKLDSESTWWIRYTDLNGQEHREKLGSKSAARAVYIKRKNEVQEGRFFPDKVGRKKKRATVQEAMERYLDANSGKANHGHHVRYQGYWNEELGDLALEDLKPVDIENYRKKRLVSVAQSTVNRECSFLRAAINLAIRDELVDKSPFTKVRQFKENNARIRFLTDGEEDELRAVMATEDFWLVEFAFLTGLRQAEQFKLRWEQVDLPNRVLTIPRSKHGEKRHVQLSEDVVAILRQLPSRMRSEWVFPSRTGLTPLNAQNYYHRVFVPALEEAGIKGMVWHDLRHTFASRLVMAGVDLSSVQTLMGHKTLQMTQRYAHLAPHHLRNAVNMIGKGRSRPQIEPALKPALTPKPNTV